MKFTNGRYCSRDNYTLTIISRKEANSTDGKTNLHIYAFTGFAKPAYYPIKVRKDGSGYAVVGGHIFNA
jgi:hypothetical protein